jgi:hypothetical protein
MTNDEAAAAARLTLKRTPWHVWVVVTSIIVVLAILLLMYAVAMKRRAVLV